MEPNLIYILILLSFDIALGMNVLLKIGDNVITQLILFSE